MMRSEELIIGSADNENISERVNLKYVVTGKNWNLEYLLEILYEILYGVLQRPFQVDLLMGVIATSWFSNLKMCLWNSEEIVRVIQFANKYAGVAEQLTLFHAEKIKYLHAYSIEWFHSDSNGSV